MPVQIGQEKCNFCGKPPAYSAKLASGREAYICLTVECVDEFAKFVAAIGNDRVKRYTTIPFGRRLDEEVLRDARLALVITTKGDEKVIGPGRKADGLRRAEEPEAQG